MSDLLIDALVGYGLNAAWMTIVVAAAAAAAAKLLRGVSARREAQLWAFAVAAAALAPAVAMLVAAASAGGASAAWAVAVPWALAPVGAGFLAAWAAICWANLLRAWLAGLRLRRRARPAEAFAELRRDLESAFALPATSLALTDEVGSPSVLGFRKPWILLPSRYAGAAVDGRIRTALSHELAHIRRRDYAVNLLSEALAAPISWHPAARWLLRRGRCARELACDELACSAATPAPEYARALWALAAEASGQPPPAAALGAADGGELRQRLERLLRPATRRQRRWRVALAAAVVAIAAAVWLVPANPRWMPELPLPEFRPPPPPPPPPHRGR